MFQIFFRYTLFCYQAKNKNKKVKFVTVIIRNTWRVFCSIVLHLVIFYLIHLITLTLENYDVYSIFYCNKSSSFIAEPIWKGSLWLRSKVPIRMKVIAFVKLIGQKNYQS